MPTTFRASTAGAVGHRRFTVEVDGERFAARRSIDDGTDYQWLTGTDQGGATSDSPDRPYDAHVADLREWLRGLAARGGERHLPSPRWRCVDVISARDVVTLVATMEEAGVHCWLDGGWGVDALLGRQTRPHNDLDLVVVCTDLAVARSVLAAQGFAVLRDWLPTTLCVRDGEGREVDFHPVAPTADGGGDQLLADGSRYHYLPPAVGSLDGRPVRCAPVESQVEMHLRYEPRDTDHADMRALAAAFNLGLPPPYSSTSG